MNVVERAVNGLMGWVNDRAPALVPAYKKHMSEYYAPKNFNLWYYFGSLAMLVLVNQIVTGIFLTMFYKPDAAQAFGSVEYIMRDVEGGWLIRYMHSTGASLFFIVVYAHMFRGLIYGSGKKPRELVWILGMLIFLTLMAEAFMGYVLPWGQMSYWGAQVIINLFGTIPVIGTGLTEWIRGDYLIADATLNRFFALHEVGSNNPDGVDIKKVKDKATGIPLDGIAFHPYYTVKDIFGSAFFLTIAAFIVFFIPNFFGMFLEHANFVPANPLVTPIPLEPVWYFMPYYMMLRSVPSFLGTQVWGVIVMGASVIILFGPPWLDRSPVKSIRYRPMLHKVMIGLFVYTFVTLGWLVTQPGSDSHTLMARLLTAFYFLFFISMPVWSRMGSFKTVPERVTMHD
jgi:ubiquinol-cytochrome c reductase cytochrome b subunit